MHWEKAISHLLKEYSRMRAKKKDKKVKETSNEAILARVTEEMAEPRVAKSAEIKLTSRMRRMESRYNAKFLLQLC